LSATACGDGPVWAVEAGAILTDAAAPLNIRYLRRPVDAALFDPLFAEVLACALALELAEELTQSDAKKAFAAGQYQAAVREALRLNAVEKPGEAVADGPWTLVRR
jgi:hypothetical protein